MKREYENAGTERPLSPAAENTGRPQRLRLPDFCGKSLTLAAHAAAWEVWGRGQDVLILGLGPALPAVQSGGRVYWLDAPQTLAAVADARGAAGLPARTLPAGWQAVDSAQAVSLAAEYARLMPETAETAHGQQGLRVAFYTAGLRLAPQFWGPLLGRIMAAGAGLPMPENTADAPAQGGGRLASASAFCPAQAAGVSEAGRSMGVEVTDRQAQGQAQGQKGAGRGPVFLLGDDSQLIHQELRTALLDCGFGPVLESVPALDGPEGRAEGLARWRALLQRHAPALVLSVNLRGLDAQGQTFALCRALRIPVAIWFVDNPWHVLSALRLPWWHKAALFVTDPSFLAGLRAAGAQEVHYLPLAVAGHMWRALASEDGQGDGESATGRPLFVGRLAFPHKARFFAAARVPQTLARAAEGLLRQSCGPADGPHFHWWQERLGTQGWPSQDVRHAGLGAEQCSAANRVRWVRAALPAGLQVAGDSAWQEYIPAAQLLPPVDYYTQLPALYARASAVLNVTSLLLPCSLSQRHFDVWAAGGFLLSDATRALELFPAELTEPVRLRGPQDFVPRYRYFQTHKQEARALQEAWRQHLRAEHGYAQRVESLWAVLASSAGKKLSA